MGCERGGRSLQACVNSDIKARNPVAEQKMGDVCWNLARIVAYVRRQLYGRRRGIFSGLGREAFAGCVRLLTWGGWPRMVGSEWSRLVYS